MKHTILALFIIMLFANYANANFNKAIVKINVVRGDDYVTPKLEESIFLKLSENAIEQRNIKIVDNQSNIENLLFIDVFLYQYPADYPSVSITIRSSEHLIYFDNDRKKFFSEKRSTVFKKLLSQMLEKIPESFQTNINYEIETKQLLFNSRVSLTGNLSRGILKTNPANYNIVINGMNIKSQNLLSEEDYKLYVANCISLFGIRKYLSNNPIKLKLMVNESGKTEIINVDIPSKINEKKKLAFLKGMEAIPTIINPTNKDFEILIRF